MIKVIALLLLGLPQVAQAKPYFRFDPLNEVKMAAYFKPGTPVSNLLFGTKTSVLKHHSEDGYFLLPGVSWSLLDVGGVKPTDGSAMNVVLGPSIDLSEPVKALALKGLDYVAEGKFEALRFILQPAIPGEKQISLSVGPSLALDPGDWNRMKTVKGSFLLSAGLSAKF